MTVEDLADSAALAKLLAEQSHAARGRVGIAFASGARVGAANLGGARRSEGWPIGCLAKLLTATLVRRAVGRGALELDGGVAPRLDARSEALQGVTVRHLLEHRHGLDDSLLAPPCYERGLVDRVELLRRVDVLERFARPGAAYSYGHGGAWLAAAMLERVHGRSFASLVHAELLEPLGVASARPEEAPLCAASGAGLELTAEQLVRFGLRALTCDDALGAAPIAPLPGWHPLERGVCLGWKYAGAGWFGHQSVWPGASSYLRVQPERRLALAVVASEEAAALVALRVFGAHLAELFEMPARPSRGEQRGFAAGVPGSYEQAARVVVIARANGALHAETWQRDARGARHGVPARAMLVPAGRVLFGRPAREHLPYAELVTGENGARWLWNGRCVLRRA